jgi:hypothetical protein
LQLDHRNSIYIDLFTQDDFGKEVVGNIVRGKYEVREVYSRNNTTISLVNNIKTDFIKHNYPLLFPPITEEDITFLSKEDI